MSAKDFETLIKEKGCKAHERWYPTAIDTYKNSFVLDTSIENTRALKGNLAYSAQYLEFLEKEFSELNPPSVIYSMLVKTYVITGMSMLEGIFSNILKSRGWWKVSDLESCGTTQSNETNFSGDKYIVVTELLRKVAPYQLQMNLDEMIKTLSRHHEALQVDHLVYPALKRLKELRNRVHLQKNESETDHDYNAFNFTVKKEMGAILFEIFSSPMITRLPNNFDFLKINTQETYVCD